jgi:GTP-binding protein
MVDVPGLIEGAHEGAGLGDRFLRHVERTRVLLHLLDGAKTLDEILHDKATIERELTAWNSALLQKPIVLALNKIDLPDAQERYAELRARFGDVRALSAATGAGVPDAIYALWNDIQHAPVPEIATPPAHIALRPAEAFVLERARDGAFELSGERIERLAAMTNFDSDESMARFERQLERMGVEKKLREMGAVEGDTVRVGTYEFTYS